MDRDEKLVQKLHNGDVASYMLVRDNPNDYSPFVLFYLGFGLFNSGYHEEGATWYYVAQLRARYDANRTLDKTTGAGVKVQRSISLLATMRPTILVGSCHTGSKRHVRQ